MLPHLTLADLAVCLYYSQFERTLKVASSFFFFLMLQDKALIK